MRTWIYWAHPHRDTHRNLDTFNHVYPTKFQVSMCGSEPPIQVLLTEDPEGPWWAWERFDGREGPTMVQAHKMLLEMCSPDFFDYEISKGLGQILRLQISQVSELALYSVP